MNEQEYLQRLFYLQQMKPYELLQELLATIFRDGGTYVSEYGPAKAVLDAEGLVRALWDQTRTLEVVLESQDAATPDSVSGGG